MNVTNSTDISLLQVKVTFDISGTTPQVLLENESVGTNLAGLTWWFKVYSPTSPDSANIHDGSVSNPDVTGDWTAHTLADAWPRPYNQIEWSGAPYKFQVFVKDSNGTELAGDVQLAYICPPAGNIPGQTKNTYGKGDVQLQVKCDQAHIFFRDQTNTSYRGKTGTIGASTLRVVFPIDDTDNIPAAFVASQFSTALVPITYSSDNYQFVYGSIWDYDMGGYVHIRIKYSQSSRFSVFCNIDLLPLVCEMEKLSNSISTGSCGDVEAAQRKLDLIVPKYLLCLTGIAQPLTGVDVPAIIEQIKAIGGFECDCCNASSGILPTGNAIVDGYNFAVQGIGGDVDGTVSVNGNNITFLLHDVSYVVNVSAGSPAQSTAFAVLPSVSSDGYTKTYTLYIDVDQFAIDLATVIGSNVNILAVWQSLFNVSGGTTVIVDGGCIFQSQESCEYEFTLTGIPATAPFALLSNVQTSVFNSFPNIPFTTESGSLATLQAYLNTLNIGNATVTSPSSGTIVMNIEESANNIIGIYYKVGSSTFQATMVKNCNSFTQITINDFAQRIVNYICNLDDSQVKVSQDYVVCYLDSAGAMATTTFTAGTNTVAEVIAALVSAGCQVLTLALASQAPDCNTMKGIFPASTNPITGTDYILGTRGGACSRTGFLEAFKVMLTLGLNNVEIRDLMCQFVALCGAGMPCPPFSFELVVTEHSTTCPAVIGINYTLTA